MKHELKRPLLYLGQDALVIDQLRSLSQGLQLPLQVVGQVDELPILFQALTHSAGVEPVVYVEDKGGPISPHLFTIARDVKPNFFNVITQDKPAIFFSDGYTLALSHVLSTRHSRFNEHLKYSVETLCLTPHAYPTLQEEDGWKVWNVQCTDDILTYSKQTIRLMNTAIQHKSPELQTTLFEALTNAVYHAPKNPEGGQKYDKAQVIGYLPKRDQAVLGLKENEDHTLFFVADFWGTLDNARIWYWLQQQTKDDALFATNGRGFFLMYMLMDEVQSHILTHEQTVLIMRLDHSPKAGDEQFKPLLITQQHLIHQHTKATGALRAPVRSCLVCFHLVDVAAH